ncbi:DoxX family protein [Pontiella sp.]|uniref:DoxX family protein n=1 Tax=Pontiella sp. TaxID=2837462 RepID=UPI003564F318
MNAKEIVGKGFATDRDMGSLIIRITLGLIIFPHGAQKLLGWFGGYGFRGTMGFFTEQLGIPALIALLVILAESLGALALIAGFITRFVAFGLGIIMIGALKMHAANGFFMNWSGNQEGEGFEFHLLVIGMALALLIKGAGRFSADSKIADQLKA